MDTTDKIHQLTLDELTLLAKLYMGEIKNLNLNFTPVLIEKGFIEEADNEVGWRVVKGVISVEDGSAQELLDLQFQKSEREVNKRISKESQERL